MKADIARLLRPLVSVRSASSQASTSMPSFGPALHHYTSGRYLYNEDARLKERNLNFDPHELANVICGALGRPLRELLTLEKFAEGGFNRILQARFHDGKEILARLPYRLEAPLRRSVASEAATLSFLRQNGIPVPEVLAYSPVTDNPVGIEYIILEKLEGRPLGERWFELTNKEVSKVMKQIVALERRYMSLALPASGSIYHRKDILDTDTFVPISGITEGQDCLGVGPIASYAWWYRERAALQVDRGPWRDFRSCFEAGAKRELAFCRTYGKPRLNVERYLRELDNFTLQLPGHHAQLLHDFLKITPHLDISAGTRFARPTLRHPDLSPNNILVNDEMEIVGIIDWQHTVILPLCLCAGIPQSYQNWGDPISESLQKPETKLPPAYDSMTPASQEAARSTMRRRLVHFFYGALTMKESEDHSDAFRNHTSMLRAKLYSEAGTPWEGSSTSLEHVLTQAQEHWPMPMEGSTLSPVPDCPLRYSPERITSCLARMEQEGEKLEELEEMREMLGTDAVGWVENDEHLARATEMREMMRTGFLSECETEVDRVAVRDHFPFDDHEE